MDHVHDGLTSNADPRHFTNLHARRRSHNVVGGFVGVATILPKASEYVAMNDSGGETST
jgi:hypothetical protein